MLEEREDIPPDEGFSSGDVEALGAELHRLVHDRDEPLQG
jgi:hypothetical protein